MVLRGRAFEKGEFPVKNSIDATFKRQESRFSGANNTILPDTGKEKRSGL
jgi:hypothetical protein